MKNNDLETLNKIQRNGNIFQLVKIVIFCLFIISMTALTLDALKSGVTNDLIRLIECIVKGNRGKSIAGFLLLVFGFGGVGYGKMALVHKKEAEQQYLKHAEMLKDIIETLNGKKQ